VSEAVVITAEVVAINMKKRAVIFDLPDGKKKTERF